MKKYTIIAFAVLAIVASLMIWEGNIWSQNTPEEVVTAPVHVYPPFYRGIYLTVTTGRNLNRLQEFIQISRKSNINTFVIDAQIGNRNHCVISKEAVDLCLQNGIHPVARVVVFTDGLSHWPVPASLIENRLSVAEDACLKGFKEIQFDYIRFSDYKVRGKLTIQQRYDFIEGFLKTARNRLRKYNIKTAADIFGRIPLNKQDAIGQRMEGLDKVVDFILPMAYPSHYTWSKKLQADPYHTVFLTSKRAKERTKEAEIVTWIQAFQMKVSVSGLSFDKYVGAQVKAVHDAGVRGYILWNARNDYTVPLAAVRNYYLEAGRISKNKSSDHEEKEEEEETL